MKEINSFILCFVFSSIMSAQKLHHQMISSGAGGSNKYLKESIGQQSIIGTSKFIEGIIQQGFIQSKISKDIFINKKNKDISLVIYPNPFVFRFNIKFPEDIKGNFKISIFDLLGKLIFEKEETINQSIITIDNFYFPEGNYLVKISNEDYNFSGQIIKS